MRFEKVTYATKFNLGNYESEDFSVEIGLEEGETLNDAKVAIRSALTLFMISSRSPKIRESVKPKGERDA